MDVITADDTYDIISQQQDPVYDDWEKSISIIKEFIIARKLIIYGGVSIDIALRLKGDKLYSDAASSMPDLDFYSPNYVEDAYDITDIIYNNGYPNARCIKAGHYSTLRVDIVDNHWVADVSYMPDVVFNELPTISFQGLQVVHPMFQYMDIHHALSYPYGGMAQRENIFNRSKRDISRFNMIYKHYPVDYVDNKYKTHIIKIDQHMVLYGFSAYSAINTIFTELGLKCKCVSAQINTIDKSLHYKSPENYFDVIHIKPSKLTYDGAVAYEPFGTFLPDRIEFANKLRVFSSENELVAVNDIAINGVNMRCCNIQPCLKWMLAMYFANINPEIRQIYLQYYASLLNMINTVEDAILQNADIQSKAEIFFPTASFYGGVNIEPTQIIQKNLLNSRLYGDAVAYTAPKHYYPPGDRPDKFDYENSHYFRMSGRKIAAK